MNENDKPKKVHIRFKVIFIYAIAIAIAALILYLIIPSLLNYGPDTINTSFDKEVSGLLPLSRRSRAFPSSSATNPPIPCAASDRRIFYSFFPPIPPWKMSKFHKLSLPLLIFSGSVLY